MSGPGGPPGAGGRGSYDGARLRSASGPAPGPASRDASLPFRPARACPGSPRRSPPAVGPPRSRDPTTTTMPSFPRWLPSPQVPPPASPPSAFTCCGSRASRPEPGPSSERHGSATLSRRRHCALRRGAARDWRAAVAAGGVEGREGRRGERAARGYTAALRPTREEQPRAGARRERAGGRPRGEGSRGRRNGCHVARWFSAPAPGPRPLPLGPAGLLQGAPTHAAGARPETRAHPCWPLALSLKRSEFRAWREAQPGPWGPEGRLSRKPAALPSPPRAPAEGGRGSLGRRKALG